MKLIRLLISISCFVILFFDFALQSVSAQTASNSFVTIINPIRGDDFWDLKNQRPIDVVREQLNILSSPKTPATFLLRYDALKNPEILTELKNKGAGFEKGIFLEVTPTLTKDASVNYRQSESWHFAESILVTGYEPKEREALIDKVFEKYKSEFNEYPKSVGAWWIDAYSLKFMEEKYGITGALIVADQYSTDGYQIWGQYWSTPYYPSLRNALFPAQQENDKIPVVLTQWAARDPVNGYGKGVEESTYSVQANDYIDYHDLGTNYFSNLIDIYTSISRQYNRVGHVVVGLENSYEWKKYGEEYRKQIQSLIAKQNEGKLRILNQKDFSGWYLQQFSERSPEQLIVSEDPLNTGKKTIWFMNPYYRVGLFVDNDEVSIRDVRQYLEGSEELCFNKSCKTINFATSAVRVLDDVTFGHRLVVDEGAINDLKVNKEGDKVVLRYINAAKQNRTIEFLPRDISIDGKISSIDAFIHDSTKKSTDARKVASQDIKSKITLSSGVVINSLLRLAIFIVFALLAFFIPGLVLTKFVTEPSGFTRSYISIVGGLVQFTLVSFIGGMFGITILPVISTAVFLLTFLVLKEYKKIRLTGFSKKVYPIIVIIILGSIFQTIPVFRSGMGFDYGIGFWGPNGHDGVWHIALSNELKQNIPPQNPAFAGEVLSNYHYFSDLLNAYTSNLTGIPVDDLIFRLYPILFSLLLGIGAYLLTRQIFKNFAPSIISLYLVYFASSFGFIVEYIKTKTFGGESAFWANQPVSFNLNPPFAISLIIVIAIFLLVSMASNIKKVSLLGLLIILAGSLIQFKAYAFILMVASLFLVGVINLLIKKQLSLLLVAIGSVIIAVLVVLPNTSLKNQNAGLFMFVPFWFIHSMIDSSDRVGWVRLSLARTTGFENGNWIKFFGAELIGFLLFLFGNFGIRVAGFSSVVLKKSNFTNISTHYFIYLFMMLSIIIPLLFIQAGNPWNTIQFLYYGIFVSSILSGGVLSLLLNRRVKYFGLPVLVALLLITPLSSIATAKGYFISSPHAYIPKEEVEALKVLSQQPWGVVLSYPYDKSLKDRIAQPYPLYVYETSSYVSAISKKPSFNEDEIQQIILQTDYKKRNAIAKNFFRDSRLESEYLDAKKILAENNIKYIYLNKTLSTPLSENGLNLEKIFENDQAIVYKTLE